MSIANTWENVEKVRIRLKSVTDVSVLQIFSSVQTIFIIITHMVTASEDDLSKHKIYLLNTFEYS